MAALAVSERVLTEGTGVCAPQGFRAGVAAAGIRGDGDLQRLDVAVVVSDRPAAAAGVFTRNSVKAAPVVISQLTLRRGGAVSAVLINAGNANACTGAQGLRDALVMCATAAEVLDLDPAEVLVCSTGVIGRPMPMPQTVQGIREAAAALARNGEAAARAIMTTDRRPKQAHATCDAGGVEYHVGGMAKGAGMIHPDMATLLGVVTTDAPVPRTLLQPMLRRAAEATFNRITVDGDTSTNDTLLLLANGAAGGDPLTDGSAALASMERCVHKVCESLAEQVVADAEGASRAFRVNVIGAQDDAQAKAAATTVAQSPLVKTAVHGADPNWGRIVAALGRSGAAFVLDRLTIAIGGITVFDAGAPCDVELAAVRAALGQPRVVIDVQLGAGEAQSHAWGCDLSPEYVHINADYTT
ncbi:MAG TPA: bifunctional glutamate N-acetyltransferase/amino-acid acetyltransferase ArgJ [Candidatus Dormibacteraeota bacterium]|nr:bifunctional glutamate N-acetyltransferase/amino-acid acetyltransferase ArgJ [Candidatus Dormibacteraeota bacterium]